MRNTITQVTSSPKSIIWTISGSDCSGGAGIAADIKTGHGLGVEVCHLITANTVQNSQQLMSVNPTPVDILQQQVDALIKDKSPVVIKIGLLANSEQVLWLTKILSQLKATTPALITVYDPVGQASVGGALSNLTIKQLTPLLAYIDIITPNLPEARALAQLANNNEVASLAKKIHHDFGISSVIIKGGHTHTDDKIEFSTDFCYHQLNQLQQDNQDNIQSAMEYQLSSPRITTNYSHGGGCCFATAMSAFLAQGYLVRDAFALAKAFINQGLSATSTLSSAQEHHYYGAFEALYWPQKAEYFPYVVNQYHHITDKPSPFLSLDLGGKKLGLYPVIDSIYWLKRLLPLGLEIIQLRVKNLVPAELEQVIIEAVALSKKHHTRLFINDYWQLAIKHGAYGVHIGQEDLDDADLVKIQQAGLRLGISTHGCYEFLLAQQLQPSYLAVGAIFPTKTKDMTGQIQGIDNLQQLLALRDNKQSAVIPVVAIGGINLSTAAKVLVTGVDSIAVVTAITAAKQPELAVAQLKQLTSE